VSLVEALTLLIRIEFSLIFGINILFGLLAVVMA
jgi:hypothetical protein